VASGPLRIHRVRANVTIFDDRSQAESDLRHTDDDSRRARRRAHRYTAPSV